MVYYMKPAYPTLLLLTALSTSLGALPTASSYAGDYCREFTQNIYVGGRIQQGYSTACLQPDGSWETVNNTPITATAIPTQSYYYNNDALEYHYPEQPITHYPVIVEKHITVIQQPRPIYVKPNIYTLTRDILGYDDNRYYDHDHGHRRNKNNHWNATYQEDCDEDRNYNHKPIKGWNRQGGREHKRVYID